jgi:hypothetical protein
MFDLFWCSRTPRFVQWTNIKYYSQIFLKPHFRIIGVKQRKLEDTEIKLVPMNITQSMTLNLRTRIYRLCVYEPRIYSPKHIEINFDKSHYDRGPFSPVSTIEELLGRKTSGSCLENREYGRSDASRWPRDTLYPQNLAPTSSTSSSRSVGIVCSFCASDAHCLFEDTIKMDLTEVGREVVHYIFFSPGQASLTASYKR